MLKKLLAFFIVSFLYFYDTTTFTFPPVKFPEFNLNVLAASKPLVSPLPKDLKVGVEMKKEKKPENHSSNSILRVDLNDDGVVNSLDWAKAATQER